MSGVGVPLYRPDEGGRSARPTVQRVSTPRRFRALQSAPVRARSGPLRVNWAPHGSTLSIAYAIPTTVGTAVVRNKVRRRLRAIFAQTAEHFPSGDLLVRVAGAGELLTWPALEASTATIGAELTRRCEALRLEYSSSERLGA